MFQAGLIGADRDPSRLPDCRQIWLRRSGTDGSADLPPEVLEALIRASGGRFSGVRYSVGYDADPTIGRHRWSSA